MGLYDDFGALIPEDKRESFKAAISQFDGAVKIDSRETVERLASENQFVKSAIDAAISKAVESHDVKFKAEKLPGLIQDELKKTAPKPKDPEVLALYEQVKALTDANAKAERDMFVSNQRAKVLPKITELGLDAEWADRLIGNNDMETEALADKFYKAMSKSREDYATKILRERFGNQGMPQMGGSKPSSIEALRTQYNDLMAKKQFPQALIINAKIKEMEKLNG